VKSSDKESNHQNERPTVSQSLHNEDDKESNPGVPEGRQEEKIVLLTFKRTICQRKQDGMGNGTLQSVRTSKFSAQPGLLRVVFASPVQSGFLPPKRATVDRNRSRTDPDIAGTEPDHLGPVFCSPWN